MPDHSSNEVPRLPDGVNPLRFIEADAHGRPYRNYLSLDEARRDPDSAVVMEGDYGGQIYLTCPVRKLNCSEEALRQLLADINVLGWDDGERLDFEPLTVGSGVSGGMGGGLVVDGLWLHPHFDGLNLPEGLTRQRLLTDINEVLAGRRNRISRPPYSAL